MADLSRLTPPGYNWERERTVFRTALTLSGVAYVMIFFSSYTSAWRSVFYRDLGGTLQCREVSFLSFPRLVLYCALAYRLTVALSLVQAWQHYLYFRTGSRSDYTMRRLGKPFERHVRVWAVPVIACAVCAVSVAVLKLICYGLYLFMTPDQFTPMHAWWQIWS